MNTTGLFTYENHNSPVVTHHALWKMEKNGMHYHSSIARNFKDLDSKSCVEESYKGHFNSSNKAIETGKYDLIFPTDNLAELLGVFGIVFSGKAAVDKTNPWKDKLNEQVASNLLTIKDIPQYKDAFHHYLLMMRVLSTVKFHSLKTVGLILFTITVPHHLNLGWKILTCK